MKKLKINFAILAMIIGVTAAFAFKPAGPKTIKGHTQTTWYFNGSTGQVQTASDWSTNNIPDDCSSTGSLPCSITVDASTQSQLQTFLNSETVAQITNMSVDKRP